MRAKRPRLSEIALIGVAVAVCGFPPGIQSAATDAAADVLVFNAPGRFQRLKQIPGKPTPEQTGELLHDGLMNSSLVTLPGDEILLDTPEMSILRHTDKYESHTHTHVDAQGVRGPDSFNVVFTIVRVSSSSTPLKPRVTFIGPISAGTGIFKNATGFLNGYAAQISPQDDTVEYAFEGEVAGEIHFAPGALSPDDRKFEAETIDGE